MSLFSSLYWAGAVAIAVWLGWTRRPDDPDDLAGLAKTCGAALLWALAWVWLLAMGLFGFATEGGILYEAWLVVIYVAITGAIWAPILVITFLARTMRERRA